jgi:XapX domain-containing protein
MVITGTVSRKVGAMKEIFMTTITGAGVGAIFALFKLPVPAPPVFAGVMGIVGLWIGYMLVGKVL